MNVLIRVFRLSLQYRLTRGQLHLYVLNRFDHDTQRSRVRCKIHCLQAVPHLVNLKRMKAIAQEALWRVSALALLLWACLGIQFVFVNMQV